MIFGRRQADAAREGAVDVRITAREKRFSEFQAAWPTGSRVRYCGIEGVLVENWHYGAFGDYELQLVIHYADAAGRIRSVIVPHGAVAAVELLDRSAP